MSNTGNTGLDKRYKINELLSENWIQPLSCFMVPRGDPSDSSAFIIFLLEISIGGTKLPASETQNTAVDEIYPSANVTLAICLESSFSNILEFCPGIVQ